MSEFFRVYQKPGNISEIPGFPSLSETWIYFGVSGFCRVFKKPGNFVVSRFFRVFPGFIRSISIFFDFQVFSGLSRFSGFIQKNFDFPGFIFHSFETLIRFPGFSGSFQVFPCLFSTVLKRLYDFQIFRIFQVFPGLFSTILNCLYDFQFFRFYFQQF